MFYVGEMGLCMNLWFDIVGFETLSCCTKTMVRWNPKGIKLYNGALELELKSKVA